MENSRHSDPSLSAKGSKVAAGSSVAKASHGKGTMKLKKSDLVLGGDGEDVKAVRHGSPEEGSRKKTKRSSHSASPSSSESSSPTSRKKKRSKRIHLMPVVKRSSRSLSPPSEAHALNRKKNVIKRTVTVRVPPKRFSRHESPSSNTDGEAQSAGEASAPRKKKINKRVLDIGQRKEDITSLTSLLARGRSSCLPPGTEALLVRGSSSCLPPGTEALLAEEAETPKQKKNDYSQPDHPASQGAGDVSINRHALAVDNCVDANLRMDKSIPPASLGSGTSEESTWTQEKEVNTPIPVTEEKISADEKQEQGPEKKEIEELLLKGVRLTDKLNRPKKLESCCTCDEREQAEIYQRLSRYYNKALQLSGQEQDDAQLNEEAEVHVYEYIFLERVKDDREWYFDPELCKLDGLEDYQRLVLRDDATYRNCKAYRRTYHTYQGDLEYVQFREKMSEKLEWIDNEAALFGDQRLKNELLAFIQSLEIALKFHNISKSSTVSALAEHLYSLRFHFQCRKDLDGVYLEIWKHVAKDKVGFGEALIQLDKKNNFPFRSPDIKAALKSYPGFSLIKHNYDTFVDGIDEKLSEEEARLMVIDAVEKMFETQKNYLDYARKKLEIADRIGLPKMSSRDVTVQGGENHGEERASSGKPTP